jgi:hypothetical protein
VAVSRLALPGVAAAVGTLAADDDVEAVANHALERIAPRLAAFEEGDLRFREQLYRLVRGSGPRLGHAIGAGLAAPHHMAAASARTGVR